MASFQDQVDSALAKLRPLNLVRNLRAEINGKVVTLLGDADSIDAKTRIMNDFNNMVKTENTFNKIMLAKPVAAAAPQPVPAGMQAGAAPAAGGERWHVIEKGETLSGIAKKYYGNANQYMKIFEANRDSLKDPDKIKAGAKIRIP
jgi:LysM repeat protein